jgi:hypothetical protein
LIARQFDVPHIALAEIVAFFLLRSSSQIDVVFSGRLRRTGFRRHAIPLNALEMHPPDALFRMPVRVWPGDCL